jgi:hypothetical protein
LNVCSKKKFVGDLDGDLAGDHVAKKIF